MPVELTAQPRTELGKQKNKQMRKVNRLPATIYGKGIEGSLSIEMDLKETEKTIRATGKTADYTLLLDGKSYPVAVKEVQRDLIRKTFVHVDFFVRNDG
jgi:large subunit ribosomal protein L25